LAQAIWLVAGTNKHWTCAAMVATKEALLQRKNFDCFGKFVKFACATVDVWFLRDTFGFVDDKIKDGLDKNLKMINAAFNVENPDWEENLFIKKSFGLYLRYMLGPSVNYFDKHPRIVVGALSGVLVLLTLNVLYGLYHLSHEPKDLGTFKIVEHLPIVPLILALCTHIIMMVFAHKQLVVLRHKEDYLPFPLTYTIFVGKLFMVVRMVMAYSSGEMGISIDYFLWQELILTVLHTILSLLIGDPTPSGQNDEKVDEYPGELKYVFFKIICIDSIKTVVCYWYWKTFQPGIISQNFDRIPYVSSQISLSILIHAVLDMVQAAATMFTMFIGRFGRFLVRKII